MRFSGIAAYRSASGFAPKVFIVGSGPAGLTLALRLAARGVPSLVLEAGGYDHSQKSQDFYRGRVVGDRYFGLHEARLRTFGGTSGHWTGWVRALDEVNFEPRPRIAHSGWPIRKADLDPYAAEASALLQVPPAVNDRPLTLDIDDIEMRYSPPVRFGTEHREAVERSPRIGLLLETAVQELVPRDGRIAALAVRDAAGAAHELPVPAGAAVCVCTGGIENSRLLLWSNARHGGQVVPQPAALGRYWMEHPSFTMADAMLFRDAHELFRKGRLISPSAAAMREHGIGGAQIWLWPERESASRVKRLAVDLMCQAPTLSAKLLAAVGDKELWCGRPVRMEWEQMPVPDNRIELDGRDNTDAFGMPRVRLHWRKSDADRRTALVVLRLFGEALIAKDLGRLRLRNWLLDDDAPWPNDGQGAAWHHLGGTRMSASPADGVVDRDCRVHGMPNLYVGGSSVFATGGHANPTFTIVQLALRLADHLAGQLTARARGSAVPADRAHA